MPMSTRLFTAFWFSYSSFAQLAERRTLDSRTSSTTPARVQSFQVERPMKLAVRTTLCSAAVLFVLVRICTPLRYRFRLPLPVPCRVSVRCIHSPGAAEPAGPSRRVPVFVPLSASAPRTLFSAPTPVLPNQTELLPLPLPAQGGQVPPA